MSCVARVRSNASATATPPTMQMLAWTFFRLIRAGRSSGTSGSSFLLGDPRTPPASAFVELARFLHRAGVRVRIGETSIAVFTRKEMPVAAELRVHRQVRHPAPIEPLQTIGLTLQQRDRGDGPRNDRLARHHADAQQAVDGPSAPRIDQVAVPPSVDLDEPLVSARRRYRTLGQRQRGDGRVRAQWMRDSNRPGFTARLRPPRCGCRRRD